MSIFTQEITTLNKQGEAIGKQLAILEAERARVGGLAESKLITNSKVIEADLNYSRLLESRLAVENETSRAKQEINRALSILADFHAAERRRYQDEFQDANLRLKEAELLQEKSRKLLIEAEDTRSGPKGRETPVAEKYRFKIAQRADAPGMPQTVGEDAIVAPGDVIYIEDRLASLATE